MKPYQINRAIAEILGATWKVIDWNSPSGTEPKKRRILSFDAHHNPRWDYFSDISEGVGADIPNFHGSLDAAAVMEAHLQGGARAAYLNRLSDIVGNDQWDGFPATEPGATDWLWAIHTATPEQRCVSFLKTMGKYVEGEP